MNDQFESIRPQLNRLQRTALIVGILGIVGLGIGAVTNSEQFFRSYLIGYMFWIGIALGAFGIFMLHNLVGGPWGFMIRRMLESAMRTLPYMVILFLPLAFGLTHLYEWSHPEIVKADPVLTQKALYLNVSGFYIRAAIYFAFWILFSMMLMRMTRRQEEIGGAPVTPRLQNLSGLGIVLFSLTVTFAVIDWVMSLEPHWSSTIYGVIFIVGQVLSTFSFVVAMAVVLMGMSPKYAEKLKSVYFHDLGNFMLAFTMVWAYVNLSQLIIIWGANLPEETPWYAARMFSGWKWVPAVLFVFHFFMPFMFLLMRKVKRTPKALMRVALFIIVMRIADLIWLIEPAFDGNRTSITVSWLDIVAPIGIGGVWLFLFLQQLKSRGTMLPTNTPFLAQQADHH